MATLENSDCLIQPILRKYVYRASWRARCLIPVNKETAVSDSILAAATWHTVTKLRSFKYDAHIHSSFFSLELLAHSSLISSHQGGGDPQLEDLTIPSPL